MIAPGASAPVRMPFQVPLRLSGNSSYLFADLATGGVNIPVTSAEPYKTGSLGKKWSHQYFDMTINALRRVDSFPASFILFNFSLFKYFIG
jgi:autotransporter translocation and assembly factor TamB